MTSQEKRKSITILIAILIGLILITINQDCKRDNRDTEYKNKIDSLEKVVENSYRQAIQENNDSIEVLLNLLGREVEVRDTLQLEVEKLKGEITSVRGKYDKYIEQDGVLVKEAIRRYEAYKDSIASNKSLF